MFYMLGLGAILAGLFLGFKNIVPYITARRSGVILRKGALGVRVRRDEDAEGFGRLLANRSRAAVAGFGVATLGVIVFCLSVLQLAGFGGPLALIMLAGYAAFTVFATICLIRGFTTGRMFAFWSLALYGDATRRQNPTWYWMYTALNVIIVICGCLTVLGMFVR